MALPRDRQGTLTPAELFFLAEQETVTIVPRLTLPKLRLVSYTPSASERSSGGDGSSRRGGGRHDASDGVIPAMRPNRRVRVPLWLAVLLKRQRRCNVEIPEWLHAEQLQRKVDEERGIVRRDAAGRDADERRRIARRRAEIERQRSGTPPPPGLDRRRHTGDGDRDNDDGDGDDDDEEGRVPGQGFSKLPLRWVELSDILLDSCGDDFPPAPMSLLDVRAAGPRHHDADVEDGGGGASSYAPSDAGERTGTLPSDTAAAAASSRRANGDSGAGGSAGGGASVASTAQTIDLTRRLLRDLREVRQAKARQGLTLLGDDDVGPVLVMDRIGSYEVNEIRGLFSGAADMLRALDDTRRRPDDDDEDDEGGRGTGGGDDDDMEDD